MAPPVERVTLATPLLDPRRGLIVSPFQFATTGDDHLLVRAWASISNVLIDVSFRWLLPSGKIHYVLHTVRPTGDRTMTSTTFALAEGFLVNVEVSAYNVVPKYGEVYASLHLVRGFTGAVYRHGRFAGGYITSQQTLGWPGTPILSSLEGNGALKFITGTNPAAGVQINEVVPANARWELLSVTATLSTAVGGGNREPVLLLDDGTANFWAASVQPFAQPPGSARTYCWMAQMPVYSNLAIANSIGEAGLPSPCLMLAGHRFNTDVAGFQAGDNWSAPVYWVREWLTAEA